MFRKLLVKGLIELLAFIYLAPQVLYFQSKFFVLLLQNRYLRFQKAKMLAKYSRRAMLRDKAVKGLE